MPSDLRSGFHRFCEPSVALKDNRINSQQTLGSGGTPGTVPSSARGLPLTSYSNAAQVDRVATVSG